MQCVCVYKETKMCGDCASLFSEEFSRVQEELVDKVFETSNQPEKTGEIEVHTHTHFLFLFFFSPIIHVSSCPSESMDADKMETNSTSHQVIHQ